MTTSPNTTRPGHTVTWPGHTGQPTAPDALFFGEPGEAIGRITSAASELKVDGTMPGMVGRNIGRAFVSLLAAACTAGIGWGAAWFVERLVYAGTVVPELRWAGVAVFGLIGLVATFAAMAMAPKCTYVGTEGLLRYVRRGGKTVYDWLRFEQAASMTSSQTRNYTNGIYTGTTFDFRFLDQAGKELFKVVGGFRQKEAQSASAHHAVHFAYAAETAWTRWRLQNMEAELADHGMLRFSTPGKGLVGVGQGFLDLTFKGKTERLTAAEIDKMTINNGTMEVHRVGATKGFFSSDGIFKFQVNGMADFRYFLVALEALLGVRF